MTEQELASVKQSVTARRTPVESAVSSKDLLSSGSTLLNLAASDRVAGCFAVGRYHFYVGDSGSGKTFFAWTCLAEAVRNPRFDDYRLIFDDVEGGSLMDLEKFFGSKLASRLEPPRRDSDGEPVYSEIVEDFYFNVYDALTAGKKPCIYILDSMDALSSRYEAEKFREAKKARQEGGKAKGDFGDGKAKINSRNIRQIGSLLRKTGSILIVICQTRDNIDAGMFEPSEVYSGGRAIKFYAAHEIWTHAGSLIKRTIRGKERQVGMNARIRIKKNRLTGKDRSITVPFYWASGIDDVGSCVDFLIEEKHWAPVKAPKKTKAERLAEAAADEELSDEEKKQRKAAILIEAPEFSTALSREQLIRHIEESNLEKDLRRIVAGVWADIEEETANAVRRKKRYE